METKLSRPDGPSKAWRDAAFGSPPLRNVKTKSKSTTRTPHRSQQHGISTLYAEGNNELCCLRLLEHLWRCRLVKRFNSQAIDLGEMGGPKDHIIDLLVELIDGSVHAIQVKSKRFLTTEVLAVLDMEREFLEPRGFNFHIWTNRDSLGPPTSHSVNQIDRGFRFPAEQSILNLIGQRAQEDASTLQPLLLEFGWDDVMSAAAHLKFHIDITKEINENTPVYKNLSINYYSFLFKGRNDSRNWWDSLAPAKAEEWFGSNSEY